MSPLSSTHAFLLGLASGFAFLAITSYRHASPSWLKALLIGSGMLLIGCHVTSVVASPHLERVLAWAPATWMAHSIGLTLPAVFAIDQLIRHPAMTPNKLLKWYAPFPVIQGAALMGPAIAPVIVEGLFLIVVVGACLMLWRKIPSAPIQRALFVLALAYGCLGVSVFLAGCGTGGYTLLLYAEMIALLALWYAYETSARLQQAP